MDRSFESGGAERMRLLISCPDRPGIVAAVTQLLYEHGANIVALDQYSTDPTGGAYFMRVAFDLPAGQADRLTQAFEPVARRFSMDWRFSRAADRKRLAIFVSREEHCLQELLWQWQRGELAVDIPFVVGNHMDLKPVADAFGIPFVHIPVDPAGKKEAEAQQLSLLEGRVDLIVLARYMQILSADFIRRYPNRIINIHHSFLPAFVGGRAYEQAYRRGVKVIGATAHYATEELDAGPIIEQDIARVDHRDDVEAIKRIGRNIERTVLARAVHWHVDDRVLVHGNKTVVFR